jgi:hypothetical protein
VGGSDKFSGSLARALGLFSRSFIETESTVYCLNYGTGGNHNRPVLRPTPRNLKQKIAEADRRIVRLPPTAFTELADNVIRVLQRLSLHELDSAGVTLKAMHTSFVGGTNHTAAR